ncbi:MAG: FtsB family cell division protein [Thermoanaerobaculia bacterium]
MTESALRFRALLWVAGAVLLVAFGLSALKAWSDLQAARRQEQEVAARIEEARRRVERLETRVEALRDDPQALEHAAREQLGLAREGEVVVVLPREDVRAESETAGSPVPSPPPSRP